MRPTEDIVRFSDVTVDFGRFELRRNSEVHSLTTREQELLRYFLEHDGAVLSRARLQLGMCGKILLISQVAPSTTS